MENKAIKSILSNLSKKNNQLIVKFGDAPDFVDSSKPISEGRKYRRIRVMAYLIDSSKKELEKINQDDLKNYIFSIQNQHTKRSNAAIIKSFYRHLNEKKYFDLIRSPILKVKDPYGMTGNVIEAKDLLTQKECLDLLNATSSKRDKCFYAMLIGGGFRYGEAVSVARSDIVFSSDNSCVVHVNGKTGRRSVRIHNGLSKYVLNWYNEMLFKFPDTPMIHTIKSGKPFIPVYKTMEKGFKRVKALAGITKPLTFHKLRHLHGTWSLLNLPRQLAYKRMGWVQNSDMAKVYSHVDDTKANEAYEQALGLKPKKNATDELLLEKECLGCNTKHEPTKEICEQCGIPIGELRLTPQDAVLLQKILRKFKTKN